MSLAKNAVIGVFAVAVAGAIGLSAFNKHKEDATAQKNSEKIVLNGIITSEKASFFDDPRVKKVFANNNLEVNVTNWTSDRIVAVHDKAGFGESGDFVFPSSVQVSDRVAANIAGAQSYSAIYSPMVIATWKPIVSLLDKNGYLIHQTEYNSLNLQKFLDAMTTHVKWKDLKDNTEYPINKSMLIYTSNAKRSGSSKTFISLASYVFNNNQVVNTDEQAEVIIPKIREMMQAQGYRESSSEDLFSDYTSIGLGKVPMMFGYESLMIEYAKKNNGLQPDMVWLYPSPTIFSKHMIVVINPKAKVLVDLINNNEELKKLAAEYGFRSSSGSAQLKAAAKSVGIDVPNNVLDVVDPPTFDMQEKIVNEVEAKQ